MDISVLEEGLTEEKSGKVIELANEIVDYIAALASCYPSNDAKAKEIVEYAARAKREELCNVMFPLADWFEKWFGDVDAQLILDKDGLHISIRTIDIDMNEFRPVASK